MKSPRSRVVWLLVMAMGRSRCLVSVRCVLMDGRERSITQQEYVCLDMSWTLRTNCLFYGHDATYLMVFMSCIRSGWSHMRLSISRKDLICEVDPPLQIVCISHHPILDSRETDGDFWSMQTLTSWDQPNWTKPSSILWPDVGTWSTIRSFQRWRSMPSTSSGPSDHSVTYLLIGQGELDDVACMNLLKWWCITYVVTQKKQLECEETNTRWYRK